ncbi:unnamed protein product [Didymodactylos carnosus]|uniref:Uncharacterized protein n=1 Tax=Didymodactylos carnosus TaxID=1234261 RepID=A0A815WJU0_9BILA|nr:unnamed protein product [Didymodactylos carnosus]CAF1548695.1 unnamed protein product [Didymodactylos carnosus]CAF3980846.1 unnamed protein product [Didymodactylos carnosus]CAF4409511.1 unnamed protein product [Didymodactylos carnosus]
MNLSYSIPLRNLFKSTEFNSSLYFLYSDLEDKYEDELYELLLFDVNNYIWKIEKTYDDAEKKSYYICQSNATKENLVEKQRSNTNLLKLLNSDFIKINHSVARTERFQLEIGDDDNINYMGYGSGIYDNTKLKGTVCAFVKPKDKQHLVLTCKHVTEGLTIDSTIITQNSKATTHIRINQPKDTNIDVSISPIRSGIPKCVIPNLLILCK